MVSPDQDLYDEDENHVIPFLETLDVFASKNGGGGVLFIVTAQPVPGDFRSQKRLLRKLHNYLAYINSDDFQIAYSPASRANTKIQITLKAGTAPEIFELLTRCEDWIDDGHAQLIVETE